MDPRRRLIRTLLPLALALVGAGGCAHLPPGLGLGLGQPAPEAPEATATQPAVPAEAPEFAEAPRAETSVARRTFAVMAPIPNPPGPGTQAKPRTVSNRSVSPSNGGPEAIAAANRHARARSQADGFLGGVQVFAYDPSRIYEVWTAPLRVTVLTLPPGEGVTAVAAGDTVRWQIGETQSGDGADRRAHVLVKPLEAGLETNLVLTTSRGVYLLQLRSGGPQAFNAAVAWDVSAALPRPPPGPEASGPPLAQAVAEPEGPLDARYAVSPTGRRSPPWTPTAVMTDGVRTYLALAPRAAARESPALFAVDPAGRAQMVNYRQRNGLLVVDRVLERAELRLGGRKGQVVRIRRRGEGAP
jgi:type IV secretion system protein VirB9